MNAIDLIGSKRLADTSETWTSLLHVLYRRQSKPYRRMEQSKISCQLIKDFTETIPLVAKAGYKNLICFSGNRNGMDDETGMKNCAEGLEKIIAIGGKK